MSTVRKIDPRDPQSVCLVMSKMITVPGYGSTKEDYQEIYLQCGRFLKHHPKLEEGFMNIYRSHFRFFYQMYSAITRLPDLTETQVPDVDAQPTYQHKPYYPIRRIVFRRVKQTLGFLALFYAYHIRRLDPDERIDYLFDLMRGLLQSTTVSFIRYCNLRTRGSPSSFSYLSHLYRRYEDAGLMIVMLNLLYGERLTDEIAYRWERSSFHMLFLFNFRQFKSLFRAFLKKKLDPNEAANHPMIGRYFSDLFPVENRSELESYYRHFLVKHFFEPLATLDDNLDQLLEKYEPLIEPHYRFILLNYQNFTFIHYQPKDDETKQDNLLIRKFYQLTQGEFLDRLQAFLLRDPSGSIYLDHYHYRLYQQLQRYLRQLPIEEVQTTEARVPETGRSDGSASGDGKGSSDGLTSVDDDSSQGDTVRLKIDGLLQLVQFRLMRKLGDFSVEIKVPIIKEY
jgi:hypothetical protein